MISLVTKHPDLIVCSSLFWFLTSVVFFLTSPCFLIPSLLLRLVAWQEDMKRLMKTCLMPPALGILPQHLLNTYLLNSNLIFPLMQELVWGKKQWTRVVTHSDSMGLGNGTSDASRTKGAGRRRMEAAPPQQSGSRGTPTGVRCVRVELLSSFLLLWCHTPCTTLDVETLKNAINKHCWYKQK